MNDVTYLAHHGVKGQKHGVRQWQNKDGSLTPAGRIHYGVGAARSAVGSAAKSVGKVTKKAATAVRKKVAPTNFELNAQIKKEQSKILNKQKRAELKRLKKTGKLQDPSKKSIRDLSDSELDDRITRLKKEATLRELEASKNISPGKKAVADALINAGSSAVKEVSKDLLTSAGKKYLGLDEKPETAATRAQKYKDQLAEKQAKDAITDYDRNRARSEMTRERDLADDELGKAVKRLENLGKLRDAYKPKSESVDDTMKRQTMASNARKEAERRVKNYREHNVPWNEIASRMGMTESQVKDLFDTSG